MQKIGDKEFLLNPNVSLAHQDKINKKYRESGRNTYFDEMDLREEKKKRSFRVEVRK